MLYKVPPPCSWGSCYPLFLLCMYWLLDIYQESSSLILKWWQSCTEKKGIDRRTQEDSRSVREHQEAEWSIRKYQEATGRVKKLFWPLFFGMEKHFLGRFLILPDPSWHFLLLHYCFLTLSWDFLTFLEPSWQFILLHDTSWRFLILLDASCSFLILPDMSSRFLILPHASWPFLRLPDTS